MRLKLFNKMLICGIIFFIISFNFMQSIPSYQNKNDVIYSNSNENSNSDIDQNITNLMKELHFASLSAGVIINNSLVWSKGYGYYRDYYNLFIPKESKTPSKDTIYIGASVSKSITATAILQLYENGYFDVHLARIVKGRFIYGGKLYDGNC